MAALYREFSLRTPSMWQALFTFVKANWQAVTDRGGCLRVIVTEDEKKRSVEQNRRYWGPVLTTIAEQAWVNGRTFHKDCWHEMFGRMFGVCDELVLPDGEIVTRRLSTTQMTVGQFSEFMTRVEAYAATELGVVFD